MYEALEFIFVGAITVIGLFFAICPKHAVKKEERENEASVAKIRKSGIFLVIASVICLAMLIVLKVRF